MSITEVVVHSILQSDTGTHLAFSRLQVSLPEIATLPPATATPASSKCILAANKVHHRKGQPFTSP